MIAWLSLLLLLCCSGIVSATETALFALDNRALRDAGRSRSGTRRRVHRVMQHPHRVLMTVLIANTAVNVAIFTTAFIESNALRTQRPVLAAVVGVGVLIAVITVGEILPKTFALANAERLAPTAAGLIAALQIILAPIRWFLRTMLVSPLIRLFTPSRTLPEHVTVDELRLLVERSAQDGAIDHKENEMLQAVVAAEEVRVREIMIPRVDIRSVKTGCSRNAAQQALDAAGQRRIIVRGRDLDDIRGLIHARDLYAYPTTSVPSLVRAIAFVPEQANVMQAIRLFRRERIRHAIVVDEYGGTAGYLSFGRILAWITGDVATDEDAAPPAAATQIDEHTYRIPASFSARALSERFGFDRIDRHIDTVGGLVLARLGRMPRVGDEVGIGNLTLTVEKVRRHRLEQILIRCDNGDSQPGGKQA